MSGVTVYMLTPSSPLRTSPYSTIWSITALTMLAGMANPIPMLPPLRVRMAEFTPTSLPLRLTRAPPEFPGLIDASVWMKSS
jgi:hypothetical protein